MYSKNNKTFEQRPDPESLDPDDPGLKIRARRRAMYLIAERPYSSGELYQKLTRNYPAKLAAEVVALMCERGYVNDYKYAAALAEKLIENKKYGKKRAAQEMRLKGLAPSIIDSALSEYGRDDIREEISVLIAKKYSDMLYERDDVRKVYAALARRGYTYDDIKYCINQYMQIQHFDENEE